MFNQKEYSKARLFKLFVVVVVIVSVAGILALNWENENNQDKPDDNFKQLEEGPSESKMSEYTKKLLSPEPSPSEEKPYEFVGYIEDCPTSIFTEKHCKESIVSQKLYEGSAVVEGRYSIYPGYRSFRFWIYSRYDEKVPLNPLFIHLKGNKAEDIFDLVKKSKLLDPKNEKYCKNKAENAPRQFPKFWVEGRAKVKLADFVVGEGIGKQMDKVYADLEEIYEISPPGCSFPVTPAPTPF